jgi:putative DNA primase/helicase
MSAADVVPFDAPAMPEGYLDSLVSEYESQPMDVGGDDDEDRERLLTEYGNACRLVDAFGHDIRRCPQFPGGGWLCWDGRRWKVDDAERIVRLSARVALLLRADAKRVKAQAKEEGDSDEKKRLEKIAKAIEAWARKSESRSVIRSTIDLAKSDPRILVQKSQLDGDRWLLNVRNGTLDLRAGRIRPHSRADAITKIANVAYDPDASSEMWEGFLLRIMEGRQDMVDFLRRAIGYSLAGTGSEQAFMVCWGGGSNGKGTMIGTIRKMLGDYATGTSAETFMAKREGSIPNDVAALDGARFVMASETKENKPLDEQIVKSVTGGDDEVLTARYMRGEWFDFIPQLTAWLLTNHKPIIKGTDKGIWRRMRLIPFLHDFETDPEKDKTFGAQLAATELEGIMAWAIRGCMEWQAGGLQEPEGVIEATLAYRQEMDIVADFIEDELQHGPNAEISNADLYKLFSEWCKENGEYVRAHRWLTREMKKKGYEQVARKAKWWRGICAPPSGGQQSYGGGWV